MALNPDQIVVAAKAYSRAEPLPLDASEIHGSLAEAQNYIKTNGSVYAGQTIKVLEGDTYTPYIINGSKGSFTLTKVAADIPEQKTEVKIVDSLPEAAQEQGVIYINTTDKKGYIWTGSWTTIFEQVDGLGTKLEDISQKLIQAEQGLSTVQETVKSLDGTVKTHTQEISSLKEVTGQIDTKIQQAITNAPHLKRQVVENLESVSQPDENTIYMVAKTAGTDDKQAYDEYMYINQKWEKLGDTEVKLADYALKTEVATAKTEAIDAAKSYADGLAQNYATAEQGKKADSALQQADITESQTNGNITVKGQEIKVHGLGSAAYTDSTAYEVAGAAAKAQAAAIADAEGKIAVAKEDIITNKINPLTEIVNGKTTLEEVKTQVIGDITSPTVKEYVDSVVQSGGVDQQAAIDKAKKDAMAYTDTSLTLTEF